MALDRPMFFKDRLSFDFANRLRESMDDQTYVDMFPALEAFQTSAIVDAMSAISESIDDG